MKNDIVLVIGGSGDVGQGVAMAVQLSGRKAVISGRNASRLRRAAERLDEKSLGWLVGDVSTEAGAKDLWHRATEQYGAIRDVVVSVNAPNRPQLLMDWESADLAALFASNVLAHFITAKIFQPAMPEDGLFIGVGGGTADFIFPKLAHVSMAQAAQRMLYTGLAKERKGGAEIRELMIMAMVAGHSNRTQARPDWITDMDVGRHICAILDEPDKFPETVQRLRSREQVGHPLNPV